MEGSSMEDHAEIVPHASASFMSIRVKFSCPDLLQMEEMDAGDPSVPFPPPEELVKYYSMGGTVEVGKYIRYDNVYLGGDARSPVWTKEHIEDQMERSKNFMQDETYPGIGRCMVDKLRRRADLRGTSVLVIGSERPWLEVLCLFLGAARVTTLEYGKITSHHPQIATLTPDEFRVRAVAGTLPTFDGVLSHSSLEHAGLGRYGDAMNPWGDILSVARAYCVTQEDGFLVLGLPTGRDSVQFNPHRVYGKVRCSAGAP